MLIARRSAVTAECEARRTLGPIDLTFLGTASASPSSTRNHSALALRLNGDIWLFDCGEATQHQIQKSPLRLGKVKKIFITHTHGDHIFGLVPLMASLSNGAGGTTEDVEDPRAQLHEDIEPLEIYGPLGTRAYVRACLTYTHTLLGTPYVVHELRFPADPPDGDHTSLPCHASELHTGKNILQENGTWNDIFADGVISVSSAPIQHSVPCVGYVVLEAPVPGKMDPKKYIPSLSRTKTPMSVMSRLQQGESVQLSDGTVLQGPSRRPGRKIVILGDTYDPSPIADIASSADLLIHEATNAYLPGIDANTKVADTFESVEERAKSRGHSTPQMAGAFATRIGARKLVLNHFSSRYAGNDDVDPGAEMVMGAIAKLAGAHFSGEVVCARDLMTLGMDMQ